MSDRIDHIRELRKQRDQLLQQAEDLRQEIFTEIRIALPKGQQAPRGRLTAIVDATGWTRAHVANIRDAKPPSSDLPTTD